MPDKLGGERVALVCVLIEAVGLVLIWLASGRILAAVGAALTGFGYSLVYPGLGVEAVRRAPPQSRGLAMGAYTVFLDVALGFGFPSNTRSRPSAPTTRRLASMPPPARSASAACWPSAPQAVSSTPRPLAAK
jgi:hypothetical protein